MAVPKPTLTLPNPVAFSDLRDRELSERNACRAAGCCLKRCPRSVRAHRRKMPNSPKSSKSGDRRRGGSAIPGRQNADRPNSWRSQRGVAAEPENAV